LSIGNLAEKGFCPCSSEGTQQQIPTDTNERSMPVSVQRSGSWQSR